MQVMAEQFGSAPTAGFCHQALLYDDEVEGATSVEHFVRRGLSAGERILVVLDECKLATLRALLGDDARRVDFANMDDVGANPARIIPLWHEFVEGLGPGQRGRGVGEPINTARRGPELDECHVHESLLNVAFADAPRSGCCAPTTGPPSTRRWSRRRSATTRMCMCPAWVWRPATGTPGSTSTRRRAMVRCPTRRWMPNA